MAQGSGFVRAEHVKTYIHPYCGCACSYACLFVRMPIGMACPCTFVDTSILYLSTYLSFYPSYHSL